MNKHLRKLHLLDIIAYEINIDKHYSIIILDSAHKYGPFSITLKYGAWTHRQFDCLFNSLLG